MIFNDHEYFYIFLISVNKYLFGDRYNVLFRNDFKSEMGSFFDTDGFNDNENCILQEYWLALW